MLFEYGHGHWSLPAQTFWISLYIQSHFNPLQNNSAEHLACHVKVATPVFAAAQVAKRTRETSMKIFTRLICVSFTPRDEKDWQHRLLRTLCHILISTIK